MAKMTGLSRAQLTRLMAQHRATGRICDRRGGGPTRPFVRRYTAADVRLLADVDAALGQRCGPATRAVLRRQFTLFGDQRFERLAGLSNGHLYTLRKSQSYRRKRTVFTKTQARTVAIGERRKPRPDGQPGFLRVDTVHQGDRDGNKGVYYINTVDEVTQYEHIGCVQAISERFLLPVLEALIDAYPFKIHGFHADNGSVIRHYLGYDHIPQRFAARVNAFTHNVLSPYLNLHRPCLFPTEHRDPKGRIRRRYRDHHTATPYEKLKSLPDATRLLKPAVTFTALDAVAYAHSDLDAARAVNAARDELFRFVGRDCDYAA